MTVDALTRQYDRLEEAIRQVEESGRIDARSGGDPVRVLACLKAYREVFQQLRSVHLMHVAVRPLRESIEHAVMGLPSVVEDQVSVIDTVSHTLMLPAVWPLLQFVLKHLLSNAVAAAQQARGQVTVSALVETNSETRCCRICVANAGTLTEDMRTSILQRYPVLKPDGGYGIGLLAAGEVLTVLNGYLSYPRTLAGIVQAVAVLKLDGEES